MILQHRPGIKAASFTVREILREHGIPPAQEQAGKGCDGVMKPYRVRLLSPRL
jgi:hypothetical protein